MLEKTAKLRCDIASFLSASVPNGDKSRAPLTAWLSGVIHRPNTEIVTEVPPSNTMVVTEVPPSNTIVVTEVLPSNPGYVKNNEYTSEQFNQAVNYVSALTDTIEQNGVALFETITDEERRTVCAVIDAPKGVNEVHRENLIQFMTMGMLSTLKAGISKNFEGNEQFTKSCHKFLDIFYEHYFVANTI